MKYLNTYLAFVALFAGLFLLSWLLILLASYNLVLALVVYILFISAAVTLFSSLTP